MEQEEAGQPPRRLVGIDLGIASRHSVRVLAADGQVVCRSSCVPAVESLAAVERAALADAPEGTTLAVVFEPTGPAWMPIAVFFAAAGTPSTGCPRRRPRTCAGSCGGTPSRTGSTPNRWRGCRWPTRTGCSSSSCPARAQQRWTGGSGLRAAHRGGQQAQGTDQGPGPAADANDTADRRPGQGRPGGTGTLR